MASQTIEEASAALKYQTWVFKVSIHCEGCKRKVKKTLQSTEGVFTVSIDAPQQKVTVRGNLEVQNLIKKLTRAGIHAELWPEKLGKAEKKMGNAENKNKENVPKGEKGSNNVGQGEAPVNLNSASNSKAQNIQPKAVGDKSPGKPTGVQVPSEADKKISENHGGGEKSSARKKKKGQKENDKVGSGSGLPGSTTGSCMDPSLEPSPTQELYNYPQPQGFYIPPVFSVSHNTTACLNTSPAGPFYCVPPFLNMYGMARDQDISVMQQRHSVSFDIFSDENVNGCHVM